MRTTGWPTTLSWSIGLRRAGVANCMVSRPSFCDHQRERALRERDLECIVLRRPSSLEGGGYHGVRPLRQSRLRCLDPPRLRRDAAERDAPRPVLLQYRRDRDDRERVGGTVTDLVVVVRAAQ